MAHLADSQELEDRIASAFKIPYRFAGLDAVVSLVADLDWLPSEDGYLFSVTGLDDCPASVASDLAHVLPQIIDRWRSGGVPFIATLACSSSRPAVLDALAEGNRHLLEAGKLSWGRRDTGPVLVVVDGVAVGSDGSL